MFYLQTRAKNYGALVANAQEVASSSNSLLPNDLHIERPLVDLVISPTKGALYHTKHNTSARPT